MDIIFLRQIRVDTVIGVYDWERQRPQPVEIDLDIGLPNDTAGHTDRIADTIDYAAVVERVRALLAAQHFQLLEALAEAVAQVLRAEFGAPWVRVAIVKPGILSRVATVGVQIERGQKIAASD